MREIKFRQWLGNRFEYWGVGVGECTFVSPTSGSGINALTTPHQQFTGLKDKNGKEIYEGDIVVCKSYPFYGDAASDNPTFNELNYVGEVYYWTEEAGFYVDLRAVTDRVRGSACGGGLSEYADGEVIGNIYENPELLG